MEANKIYFDSYNLLWLGRSQGSGHTTRVDQSLITNVNDLGIYDPYICEKIMKFTEGLIVIRKKDTQYATIRLYKIPVYGKKADRYLDEKYDIFGGEIKPTGYKYLSWTKEKGNIFIHTFKSLGEAKGYHQF